jgi:ketosteroid isomerase-like protein
MTEEEILRRSLEAWNENDWETLEKLWDPEGEIVAPEGWPESGVRKGWPAIRDQFDRIKDSWSAERVEVLTVGQEGDRLLAHIQWIVRGEASGAPLEVEMWMVCEFHGERFSRIQYFLDGAAARQAAKADPAR